MSLRTGAAFLWALVLVVGGIYIFRSAQRSDDDPRWAPAAEVSPNHDGRVFVDVPWKHLPTVRPFQLTEKSGEAFDSRSLAGQPYVLSFFFTRCPTICMDLNDQISILANRFEDTELKFIGLTVDPKYDTPEVLRDYAEQFQTDPDQWLLLTGREYKINQIAEQDLYTVADGEHHTGDIFLIDRWGRFRDRFSWDDPREMKRFGEVAREVLAEKQPPLGKTVSTRNVMASLSHERRNRSANPIPWLKDFQLTDQDNQPFYSRDLTGKVWVASFFFTRCGTICPQQNQFLAELLPELEARNVHLVSITTDPSHDSPDVLRTYARSMNATEAWSFLTGDFDYIRRIGSEFLGLVAHGKHHSTQLAVVDRWGNVRGRFNWQAEGQRQRLLELVDRLNLEERPPAKWHVIDSKSQVPPTDEDRDSRGPSSPSPDGSSGDAGASSQTSDPAKHGGP